MKANRFCWMGSTRPMDEFNYFFRQTEHGVICAHTYQYEPDRSTWVFEMDEACFQGHGFEEFDEEGSKAKLETIFAEELAGHPLLLNRSMWRRFPRIFCENWWHENIVILGDAKASAHFSIGSGTKLAMECAIALSDAVVAHGETDVQAAFQAYDEARRTPCQIIQHNADVSLSWFEHMNRSFDMDPDAVRDGGDVPGEVDHLRQSRPARPGLREAGGRRLLRAHLSRDGRRLPPEPADADVHEVPAARTWNCPTAS